MSGTDACAPVVTVSATWVGEVGGAPTPVGRVTRWNALSKARDAFAREGVRSEVWRRILLLWNALEAPPLFLTRLQNEHPLNSVET